MLSSLFALAPATRCKGAQFQGELVHLYSRALSDSLSDLNCLGDLLAIRTVFQGFANVVFQAGLAVSGHRCADGNQFQDPVVESHAVPPHYSNRRSQVEKRYTCSNMLLIHSSGTQSSGLQYVMISFFNLALARCSRILAASTLTPIILAISLLGISSMSLSTSTAR